MGYSSTIVDTSVIETGMFTVASVTTATLCQNVVDEYAAVSEQQVVFNGSL